MIDAKPKRPDGAQPRRPRSISVSVSATAAAISDLRHRAAEFAASHGADKKLVDDVALAVSEAVTNVVKYAYGPGRRPPGGKVELEAAADGDWLEVHIFDRGAGFGGGASDGLGLGLSIMASLSAELTIVQEGEGTEVRMRFPLPAGR